MNQNKWFGIVGMLTVALVGCGGDDSESPGEGGGGSESRAWEYYRGSKSSSLGAQTNQATCSTCHSDNGTQVGYSGSSFKDIAYHTSFKGGTAKLLRDAINACVTGWMGGVALGETDEGYLQLKEYLESVSDKAVTTPNDLAPEVLANVAAYEAAYQGGDANTGIQKFNTNCAQCHASELIVGGAKSPSKASLASTSIGHIAQKVRTSGPPPSSTEDATASMDTTPGPMPFFEPKDLSVTDLKDIIAAINVN